MWYWWAILQNGNLIPKKNFKHPKNGTFRAYTKKGFLYLEITYANKEIEKMLKEIVSLKKSEELKHTVGF